MSGTYPGPIDRLRRPEYTGENRCMPCTIVNTAIAIVLAAAVAGVVATYQTSVAGLGAGAAVLVVSALAIALRGYLVPYTPYITKTYFPDRVLRWFEKEPPAVRAEDGIATDEEVDADDADRFENADGDEVEEILVEAGALEECDNVDDLCVTESFRDVWRDHIHDMREGDGARRQIMELVDYDLELDDVSLRNQRGAMLAKGGRQRLGKWKSEAAFVADMAAARALEETYDGWDDLTVRKQSAVLNGVRVFLEQCPMCDGLVTVGEEHVETCCREYDIMAVTCEDCGASLFESGHELPSNPMRTK